MDIVSPNPARAGECAERLPLLALIESSQSGPILVGRLDETIEAGKLLAPAIYSEGQPVLRAAADHEIGVFPWHGSEPDDLSNRVTSATSDQSGSRRLKTVHFERPRCPECDSGDLKTCRSVSEPDKTVVRYTTCRTCKTKFVVSVL